MTDILPDVNITADTTHTVNNTSQNENDTINDNDTTQYNYTFRQKLIILCTLLIGDTVGALDETGISVAVVSITNEFGSYSSFGWLFSSFLIASAVSLPLFGKFGDMFGRQIAIQTGIYIFLLGSILAATSSSMTALIAYRAIQGCGLSGIMVTYLQIITDIMPPLERGKWFGLLGGASAATQIGGPLICGFIVSSIGWRYIFWLNVPLMIFMSVMCFIFIRIPRKHKYITWSQLDIPGLACITIATTLLCLGLIWGGTTYAWNSAPVICCLVLSITAFVLFAYIEYRTGDNAVYQLSMLQNRNFTICVLCTIGAGALMQGIGSFLPAYFQQVYGDSAAISGIRVIPMIVPLIFSAMLIGTIVSKTGKYRYAPLCGALIELIAVSSYLAVIHADLPYTILCVLLIVLGVGAGAIAPIIQIIIGDSVKPSQQSQSMSVYGFAQTLGSLISAAVMTTTFNGVFQHNVESIWSAAPQQAVNDQSTVAATLGVQEYHDIYTTAFKSIIIVVCVIVGTQVIASSMMQSKSTATGNTADTQQPAHNHPVEQEGDTDNFTERLELSSNSVVVIHTHDMSTTDIGDVELSRQSNKTT